MKERRALVVDDDPDQRFRLVRHIRASDAIDEVDEVSTAVETVVALEHAEYCVIILDLGLPDKDGLDLIPEIRNLAPEIQIICLTGRDEARSAVRALHAGAAAYVVKPWDRDELVVHVQRAVEHYRLQQEVKLAKLSGGEGIRAVAGNSPAWLHALDLAREAAQNRRATVLIRGESGSGKEVVASLIHRWSARAAGPFVTINVASVPSGLLESEFFGQENGAYAGANNQRKGLFELASGGTLFLDEIGEMPMEMQPRLLRVLEGYPLRRLGGEKEIQVDVRILAATHRNLEEMVSAGTFREDLLYRLNVIEVRLPPLRERRDDIEPLVLHFLQKLMNPPNENAGISKEAMLCLESYTWPGNVRELRNVVERSVVASRGTRIEQHHLPPPISRMGLNRPTPPGATKMPQIEMSDSSFQLEEAIRRHIEKTWSMCGGNLSRTARELGLSRVALRRRLRLYGLVSSAEALEMVSSEPVVDDEPPQG
jgi:DNA-binding NtrC family response regulator